MENTVAASDCWSSLPSEILRDVLSRIVTQGGHDWPERRSIVATAGVCRSWRAVAIEMMSSAPSSSQAITFPADLKTALTGENLTECYILRNGKKGIYRLYLGSTPSHSKKFLLAAKKCSWHPSTTDYIISLDPTSFSRSSETCVGILRANFLNSKFSIHDMSPANLDDWTPGCAIPTGRRFPAPTHIGSVSYAINMTGLRGPRRIQCSLDSTPSHSSKHSRVESGQFVLRNSTRGSRVTVPMPLEEDLKDESVTKSRAADAASASPPKLLLKNKQPIWHDQHQCWCLDFKGRVTEASVKNFQLVEGTEDTPDTDKPVLLQFGKISKNTFTMDYRQPLSLFQAFVICLTSFETKVSCD